MDNFLEFFILFLKVSFYPIGIFIICGLVVALCEKLVVCFCGRGGRGVIYATSIIGTPVHEMGHALMCLVFGHKITEMRLWSPQSDGNLGYVEHAYNKKNPYMILGNLFIGIGPVFSGLLFIFLVMCICFPYAFDNYVLSVFTNGYEINEISELFTEGFYMVKDMVSDDSMNIFVRILGIFLIICTCLHINLSFADIKNSLSSLPVYLLITLLLTCGVYFIGGSFGDAVMSGFSGWLSIGFTLYLPVILCSAIIVALAFLIYIIRMLCAKK